MSWRQNHREYTGKRHGPDAEPAALDQTARQGKIAWPPWGRAKTC